jgi:hypothetical protein
MSKHPPGPAEAQKRRRDIARIVLSGGGVRVFQDALPKLFGGENTGKLRLAVQ